MPYVPRLSRYQPPPEISQNHWYSWVNGPNGRYTDNWYVANGYGPPNCTWYAYGRFNEIRGTTTPQLSYRTAKYWFEDSSRELQRGQTPALGAVICWGPPAGFTSPGHVAIVEEIHADGSLTLSESGWGAWYFHTDTVTRESGYRESWMYTTSRQYSLQGFIYQPGSQALPVWHAYSTTSGSGDVGYAKESPEAHDNAYLTYSTLYGYGWTLEAVCALLGNFDAESSYNPWCWQSPVPNHNNMSVINNDSIGYGLVQWTAPNTYIGEAVAMQSPYYAPHFRDVKGSPNDGYAQLYAIENQGDKWYVRPDPDGVRHEMTFDEFKHSTGDVPTLTKAFLANYEFPKYSDTPSDPGLMNRRIDAALYWYGYLKDLPPFGPGPGPTPKPVGKDRMPLLMYMKSNLLRW